MTSVRVEADDRGGATLTVGHPPINLVLVLGCDDIDAHTAERWGWVHRVVAADEIDGFVDRLAGRIASFPANAVAAAKQIVLRSETGVEDDLVAETVAFNATLAHDETHDRMQRFLDAGGQTPEGERRLGDLAAELSSTATRSGRGSGSGP